MGPVEVVDIGWQCVAADHHDLKESACRGVCLLPTTPRSRANWFSEGIKVSVEHGRRNVVFTIGLVR